MAMRRLKKAALCFGLIAATLASLDVGPVMATHLPTWTHPQPWTSTKALLTGGKKYTFRVDPILNNTGTKDFEWNHFGEGKLVVHFSGVGSLQAK
jgi:hypothetical protein